MKSSNNSTNEANSSWFENWINGPRSKAREASFLRWVGAWGVSFVFTIVITRQEWLTGPVVWVLPCVTVLLSLVMALRYYQFVMNTDELARKIQLEAVAWAFGITTLLVINLEVFEPLVGIQMEDNYVVAMMGFIWSAAQVWGRRRYQ